MNIIKECEIKYLYKKPEMSERIKKIKDRMDRINREGGRGIIYSFSKDIALGQAASGPASGSRFGIIEAFTSGESKNNKIVSLGDQSAVVRNGKPFPGELPSSKNGFTYDVVNFATDLASFYDQNPAEIYPGENIVGEYHWSFGDLRPRVFPDPEELEALGEISARFGSSGYPVTHSCVDLSIGINQGWTGILSRIKKSIKKFEAQKKKKELEYLYSAKIVCESIINFIQRHSDKAIMLASEEKNSGQKKRYLKIAEICKNISINAPESFHEGVQWVWFYIMVERMLSDGNGYDRLDQDLYDLYKNDIENKVITRDEARDLVAELYLKFPTFFTFGGRDKDGNDATNELSWVCIEAYDMTGTMMEMSVMWHSDIDPEFFRYACAVVARHGTGSLALVNQDVLSVSEIYYGVKPEDAWNVVDCGCFWYTIPGKEWCGHDTLSVSGIKVFMNALETAIRMKVKNYSQLWKLYGIYLDKAIAAFKELTDWQFLKIPYIYPEITPSLLTHDCIENGRDITDLGTSYNTQVVQFSGIANVADSLVALKKLVFDEKKITLDVIKNALEANFEGYEDIRQLLLDCPKFGNDIDEVDNIAIEVADKYREILSNYKTVYGYAYRPAFFSWAGHAYAEDIVGATPDGRKKEDPIAQGANPMHGRNTEGITATARSVAKLDFTKNAGGNLQLELDPSMLGNFDDPSIFVESIVVPYFKMNGPKVFINIVSVDELRKAINNPENYAHIIVRVTGFSSHFIHLDRKIQEEIIKRTRYSSD
ncbi:MAG: hypothetical protein M1409_10495 [Actinobacteria bacterium]|nr:hypothetical protein [Actinomycetota bacterium]